MSIALSASSADVGVAVVCSIINAPPKPGQNGQGGLVPMWMLVTTMADPLDITGPVLRDIRIVGNGAPDWRSLAGTVKAAEAELRDLSSTRLRGAGGPQQTST